MVPDGFTLSGNAIKSLKSYINAQPLIIFSVRVHFGSYSDYLFICSLPSFCPPTDTAHNITAKQEKKRKTVREYKSKYLRDRSLFCSVKIPQPVSCNNTWYLVRGTTICTLTCFVDCRKSSYFKLKTLIEMLIKKMVEYPNDPPVSYTACQPLSRKSSPR